MVHGFVMVNSGPSTRAGVSGMIRKPFVILVLASLVASCRQDPRKLKERYLASGDQYVSQKNYREAVIQYRNAVAIEGTAGDIRLKLGTVYEALGENRNALGEYVRAADLMPDNDQAQLQAGKMLVAYRRFDEAKARATKVLEKDPKNVNALIVLGNALAGLK